MKIIRRPKAPPRLQRFILWTALVLAWAGEVVSGVMKRFRAGHKLKARIADMLPRLTDAVGAILLTEALVLYGRPGFLRHKRFCGARQKLRALLGPAIRRLLRGNSVAESLAQLAHVLRHRAPLVRRIARRIARGLTHAHIAPPYAATALALPTPTFARVSIDSS